MAMPVGNERYGTVLLYFCLPHRFLTRPGTKVELFFPFGNRYISAGRRTVSRDILDK